MAWKKKSKDLDEEYEDEYEDEAYDDEYDDEYDEYDDEYDDYEEKRRNPLKGVVVVLVILALLLAAAAALLYLRMQTAEAKVEKLTTALNNAQTEISRLQAESEAAALLPAATPEPAAVPEATPVPETAAEAAAEATPEAAVEATPEAAPETTPEPTAEPEPTEEPTPTPGTAPKDVTDEMLGGVFRPADEFWLEEARTAWANSYMVAAHWGPGLDWTENLVLYQNDKVEILAMYNNWSLLRTQNDKYGWVVSGLLTETAPAGAEG